MNKFWDGADSTRADIANCSIHFMMGDASNSGWLQISMHQTMKIMSKYCWADVQSKEGAFTQCTSRILLRIALVVRAVVCVSGAGLQQETWRQDLLELAKHPAWFLFFASGCFKAQTSTCREGAVKAWRRICRWFGCPHGYFCTLATKLMNLRKVYFP